MPKKRTSEKLNELLTLTKCDHTFMDLGGIEKPGGENGYWLYDKHFGMNLAMRSPTEKHALLEALDFYQERFIKLSAEHADLKSKVDTFVSQFRDDEDDDE